TIMSMFCCVFFFSSRRRHTRFSRDWSSDVCSSDLMDPRVENLIGSLRDTGFIIREPNRSGSLTFTAQDPDGIGSVKIPGAEMTRSEERRVGKECRSPWRRYH